VKETSLNSQEDALFLVAWRRLMLNGLHVINAFIIRRYVENTRVLSQYIWLPINVPLSIHLAPFPSCHKLFSVPRLPASVQFGYMTVKMIALLRARTAFHSLLDSP